MMLQIIKPSCFATHLLALLVFAQPLLSQATDLSDSEAKQSFNIRGCNACHNVDEMRIGPSYRAVAMRYDSTDENVERLAMKILFGGSGAWGVVPMVSNPAIRREEAESLANWILRQKVQAPPNRP